MKKINIEAMETIRNEFAKNYSERDFQYLGYYHSYDFSDYVFTELYSKPEVNNSPPKFGYA